MLNPSISKRLDKLLAYYEEGVLSRDEVGLHLDALIEPETLPLVLDRLPADLIGPLKEGIAIRTEMVADNEYLHPEDSPFLFPDSYPPRGTSLLLDPDVPGKRGRLHVVCLPSFEPEWALRVLGFPRTGYSLLLTSAERQVWSPQAPHDVRVRRTEAPLESDLAEAILEVWLRLLLKTRHPRKAGRGCDGVIYHFGCHNENGRWLAGTTWSPSGETAPGRLVALSHSLCRYVEALEPDRAAAIKEIRERLRRLQLLG